MTIHLQMNELQTTTWDNSNIYSSFQDPRIQTDLEKVRNTISTFHSKTQIFEGLLSKIETLNVDEMRETIPLARELSRLKLQTFDVWHNLRFYGGCAVSQNAQHQEGRELVSQCNQLIAQLAQASKPLQLFLNRAPDEFVNEFLKDDSVKEIKFTLEHERQRNEFLLSNAEEVLAAGLAVDGLHAWSEMYSQMASTLKVPLEEGVVGMSTAAGRLFSGTSERRQKDYRAINEVWQQNEIPCASVLNSISGLRLELNKRRSFKKPVHFLDTTCHSEKISRETLDTLINTTYENRDIGHKALKLMAKEFGVAKLGPWDLLAPYPAKTTAEKISFPKAMDIIIQAFNSFDPAMGSFAEMAWKKNWIDGTPTENRGGGAHCGGFAVPREPRVFQTFEGSMKDVITLAHELGHAYHAWVMRDLPLSYAYYTSGLAETASVFAETLTRQSLLNRAKTTEEKKAILWLELEAAISFMINIPARFHFEKNMMETRQKKSLNARDMKTMTQEAWKYWYEDNLSEYNEMFWASKQHFSFTKISFYNYPYLFGYLFSLGIYAKKNSYGEGFKKMYVDLLRDTGILSPEDLVQKYFKQSVSDPSFWKNSMDIVRKSVDEYALL